MRSDASECGHKPDHQHTHSSNKEHGADEPLRSRANDNSECQASEPEEQPAVVSHTEVIARAVSKYFGGMPNVGELP